MNTKELDELIAKTLRNFSDHLMGMGLFPCDSPEDVLAETVTELEMDLEICRTTLANIKTIVSFKDDEIERFTAPTARAIIYEQGFLRIRQELAAFAKSEAARSETSSDPPSGE